MEDRDLAEALNDIFAGLKRCYGKYVLSGVIRQDGKLEGRGTLCREELNSHVWLKEHLKGEGIGVIPINDECKCNFGAIDIDLYNGFDPIALAKKIADLQLPLILCRSKSGGAHVFCFTREHVPAQLMIDKLREFASGLGIGNLYDKVFPSQSFINKERGDIGNWINIPYAKGAETKRYAYGNHGEPLL